MSDRRRPILFCATGIHRTVGGIASANRNVLAGLEALGREQDRAVRALVLGEPAGVQGSSRAFGGSKLAFSLAVVRATPFSALVVFDHVRLALPILAVPRPLRPKIAICAHGSEAWWRIQPSNIRAFRAADLVLANSAYTLARMRSVFSGFRGVSCPLGLPPQVQLSDAPPAQDLEPMALTAADGVERPLGPRVLLLVARLDAAEREKGHRELLQALPAILERHPEVQLVFAGGGSDLDDLRRIAAGSAAASHAFLPGSLDDAQLARLYRKAYAYVMPSRQEGFGLVYLEAMNSAKPCLACRDDGGADVVVDGETGVLIPRRFTHEELVAGLERLLQDQKRSRAWGEAGWRRLMKYFTATAHQERVADFLRPLLPGT